MLSMHTIEILSVHNYKKIDFKSKVINDDLVITRYDFDPKYISIK